MNIPPLHSNGPVPGLWNDGKSAVSHPVMLFHRPHQRELRICPAASGSDLHPLAVWPMDRIRVLSGSLTEYSPLPLRLAEEPDNGQRLTVENGPHLALLAAWMRGPQAERRADARRRWFMGTAAVWMLFLGLYFTGPALFSFAVGILPQSWEARLGKSARDSIVDMLVRLPGVRSVNEEATNDPNLKQLLARLEKGAPTQGYAFDLLVLDADFVNAFALPGGYMLVSTGLVKACQSPDELAGVLAHEMAHVTGRHGTARMLREQLWTVLLRLVSGSDGLAAQLAGNVITSSFDRDDERDADARGVERLVGAGINPMGLADFFARLEKEEAREKKSAGWTIMSYVASHPELAERQDNIRRTMLAADRENAPVPSPAMSPEQWRKFRTVCGITAATYSHSLPRPSGHTRVRPAA
jgi:Zn-dependent protease with chaperone function